MKKPLRVAVVGQGRWGSRIVATLRALPACTLTDTVGRDWQRLLAKNLNGVVIATPSATHARIATAFIKRGIPTFVEKPLTTSLKEAKGLLALAKRHRVPIFVGHLHLYNQGYLDLKKRLRTIGRVRQILTESGGPGPIRKDTSVLWDWLPHDAALLIDLLQEAPKKVQAWSSNGVATTVMTFPSGVIAHTFHSWLLSEKRRRLTVVGTNGSLVFDDFAKNKKAAVPPLTAELSAWLTSLRAKKNPSADFPFFLAVMQVLDAAERSAH